MPSLDPPVTGAGPARWLSGRQVADAARERWSAPPTLSTTAHAGGRLESGLAPAMAVIGRPAHQASPRPRAATAPRPRSPFGLVRQAAVLGVPRRRWPVGRGQEMARRPKTDERQADFFGPAPVPAAPGPPPAQRPKPQRDTEPPLPSQAGQGAPAEGSLAQLAAGLPSAELNEFAAALPDTVLAQLALAAARQLRRRLTRRGGRGKSRTAALERTARQIAAELSGRGEGDDT
ncbi:MAG: hypothetical protein JOY65_03060 [Acetobacteraceae bacterium]|nr:hypothetical protein [Acetobacteraceae bacterium]